MPTIRELLRELRAAGGVPLRTKGSHQVWQLPKNIRIVLPVQHRSKDASPNVVRNVRDAIKRSAEN